MNNILSVLILILPSMLIAAIEDAVFVEGFITSFDKKDAVVLDIYSQEIKIPKNIFPKNFNFRTGIPITLEINDKIYDTLEIKKVTKKINLTIDTFR